MRDLTSSDRFHDFAGPAYDVGDALLVSIIAEYGVEKSLNFYFESRPGRFDKACRTELGVDLDTLEAAFWEEMQRAAEGGVDEIRGDS